MNQSLNIEQLLERLAVAEAPEDTAHRYALRRALLNSRAASAPITLWTRLFAFTGTLVVGGVSAGAVVVTVLLVEPIIPASAPLAQEGVVEVASSEGEATTETITHRTTMDLVTSEYISANIADMRNAVPVADLLPFMRTPSEVALTR